MPNLLIYFSRYSYSTGGKSGRPFGGRLSLSSFKDKPGLGSQNSLAGGGGGANARSSYRGSVEPEVETGTLQKHALYIFGEKSQVKGVNVEKFPKADFIPVEYPEPKRLRASFRKLMRACAPSSLQQGGELNFHKQVRLFEVNFLLTSSLSKVESSEWLQLLQTVMQLAGAVTDLMDLQVRSEMCQ